MKDDDNENSLVAVHYDEIAGMTLTIGNADTGEKYTMTFTPPLVKDSPQEKRAARFLISFIKNFKLAMAKSGRLDSVMEKSQEIFKVQLPIASSEEYPKALVYNEDRTIMFAIPTEKAIALFQGNTEGHKGYFYGIVEDRGDEEGEIELLPGRITDRDW